MTWLQTSVPERASWLERGTTAPECTETIEDRCRERFLDWPHIWGSCWKVIRSWPIPRQYSPSEWRKEVAQLAEFAVCAALNDYDDQHGLTLDSYVGLRIRNAVLDFARKESRFSRHIQTMKKIPDIALATIEPPDPAEQEELQALAEALAELAPPDRQLIAAMLLGQTQQAIAAELGKTQSWVSKQKTKLLKRLRKRIEKTARRKRILE